LGKAKVSVTSADYDPSKSCAHARVGVKECCRVLEPEKQVEVHRQPAGDHIADRAVRGPGGRLTTTSAADFTVDLNSLLSA
jgi:hypothetical protein